ncbi:MAG TPA: uroporphyrinogen decarboxylase family protein, partial [Aggregatilineaceae bacterium]|nr:uroporphyrinogen decarboxylase family protein [Aggregatilineaceae bacterium]
MNSRERFVLTMQHQAPDRVPIDIGATSLTGMRPLVQQRLRDLLGFTGAPLPANNGIDERVLQWAGTDFRSVGAIVNLPNPRLPDDPAVDCWGVRRAVIDGEAQITQYPLHGASIDDLHAYPWPEPRVPHTLLELWEDQARTLHATKQYVVIAEHPVYGILELGCWMCGYDDFLMRLASDPDFVRTFFDYVFAIQMQVIEPYYALLGPYIDLTTSGDDFGIQMGPMISPRTFRELIAPYFRARIERTKELAKCYYWHHSCGSVYALIDQFITCGVDILNPIQTSAAKMAPQGLKERFGTAITFWGGVDVQQFLPRATPADVTPNVRDLARIL